MITNEKKPLAQSVAAHLKYMILGAIGGAALGAILYLLSLNMNVPGTWGFGFTLGVRRFTFDVLDLLGQVLMFAVYGMSVLEILRAFVVGVPMGWKVITGRFEPVEEEVQSTIFSWLLKAVEAIFGWFAKIAEIGSGAGGIIVFLVMLWFRFCFGVGVAVIIVYVRAAVSPITTIVRLFLLKKEENAAN